MGSPPQGSERREQLLELEQLLLLQLLLLELLELLLLVEHGG